ncbi:hypothetical protein [Phaeodactylibacter luteus]|uniref:Uncharacterized protein n=1 Tax=Phaeodactylibacter luteus TaxID=1564516 RepID=A0A5C6RH91_9BACT|nr:hypothetical protein [Phaeodactylibacter luteus]TXB61818.1 hypothetical protein FRY97_17100 [Phaeodactylibacter luteus]
MEMRHIRHWLQLLANLGSAPIALRNLRYNRERTFVLGRYSLPMSGLELGCSHNLPLGLGLGYRAELGLARL